MAEKIYRVNMATLTATSEDVPEKWKALGGRGLTSTIVAQEVKPTCNPLGKYNKLVFAPGCSREQSARTREGFPPAPKVP